MYIFLKGDLPRNAYHCKFLQKFYSISKIMRKVSTAMPSKYVRSF